MNFAKQELENEKKTLAEEASKHESMRDESEKTEIEILKIEENVQRLQEKYDFQHEDLIRRRSKLKEQNNALRAINSKYEKLIESARTLLDGQRIKIKNLERSEEEKKGMFIKAYFVSSNMDRGGDCVVGKKRKMYDEFEKIHQISNKRQIKGLEREVSVTTDYATFSSLIANRAKTLDKENEDLRMTVVRLEAVLAKTEDKSEGKKSTVYINSGNDISSMVTTDNLRACATEKKRIVAESSSNVSTEHIASDKSF